jgi:hypothetical protein
MSDLDQKIRATLHLAVMPHELEPATAQRLADALKAVLWLHKDSFGHCTTCHKGDASEPWMRYPCPTVESIAHRLGLTQETTP